MSESIGAGASRDWEAQYAQQALSTLIVELLRALARGDDHTRRVTTALIDFTQRASKAEVPLGNMVHAVIAKLHGIALANEGEGDDSKRQRGKFSSTRFASQPSPWPTIMQPVAEDLSGSMPWTRQLNTRFSNAKCGRGSTGGAT